MTRRCTPSTSARFPSPSCGPVLPPRLCATAELDPALTHMHVHTGYGAWDAMGRFYFASFDGSPEHAVIVTRIDPPRLERALAQRAGTAE